MKTIIIDGYNAMHGLRRFAPEFKKGLAAARAAFMLYLSGWRKAYSKAELRVVFDTDRADEFAYPAMSMHGVDFVFAQEENGADARIISMVRASENPRDIVVVSDDNNIRYSSRTHGARVEHTNFLLRK